MPAIPLPSGNAIVIEATTTVLLLATLVVAVYTDLRRGRIYNKITFGAAAAGLLLNTMARGAGGALASVEGWLLGAALFVVFFLLGVMGAGDVKLLAAVGALGGPSFVFHAFLFTGLAGGAIAILVLLLRRRVRYALAGVAFQLHNLLFFGQLPRPGDPKSSPLRFPYGTAIAVGSFAAFFVRL